MLLIRSNFYHMYAKSFSLTGYLEITQYKPNYHRQSKNPKIFLFQMFLKEQN